MFGRIATFSVFTQLKAHEGILWKQGRKRKHKRKPLGPWFLLSSTNEKKPTLSLLSFNSPPRFPKILCLLTENRESLTFRCCLPVSYCPFTTFPLSVFPSLHRSVCASFSLSTLFLLSIFRPFLLPSSTFCLATLFFFSSRCHSIFLMVLLDYSSSYPQSIPSPPPHLEKVSSVNLTQPTVGQK